MVPLPASIWISPAPAMQHLPHPRATTAAWLVMPPVLVRMPAALCMPSTSSGLVSLRTRMTRSPLRARLTASSAVKAGLPTAAPGEAAAELINAYGSLEALLEHAGEIKQPKRRENLLANAELARISKRLVTLDADHPDVREYVDWKAEEEQKVLSMVVGSRLLSRHAAALEQAGIVKQNRKDGGPAAP